MKTTARMLTGASRIVPKTETIHLIKSRIRCNIGFAYNLMEKYEFSESQFPPASFVMLKTGEKEERQEEKVQIVNLLLQILRSGDFAVNQNFYNLILGRLQAELHFYFNQLGYGPDSGREYLKGIYEEILEVVKAREADQTEWEEDKSRGLFSVRGPEFGLDETGREIQKGRSETGTEKEAAEPFAGSEWIAARGDNEEERAKRPELKEERTDRRFGEKPTVLEGAGAKESEAEHGMPKKTSADAAGLERGTSKKPEIEASELKRETWEASGIEASGIEVSRLKYGTREENGIEVPDLKRGIWEASDIETPEQKRGMGEASGIEISGLKHQAKEASRIGVPESKHGIWKESGVEVPESERERTERSGIVTEPEKKTLAKESGTFWMEKRAGLEQRLIGLWRELHGQAHMPSVEAARIYDSLETLTKEQQQAMAQVMGYDRIVLLEKLKGADNQTWRSMKEQLEQCLKLAKWQDEEEIFQAGKEERIDFSTGGKSPEEGGKEFYKTHEPEENNQKVEAVQEGKKLGLELWRHSLCEWIGYLESQDWEILLSAVKESPDAGLKDVKKAFLEGQKQEVMEYLARIENMEELVPMIRLIYREKPLGEMAKGWLPEESHLLRKAELLEASRQLLDSSAFEEKKLFLDKWFSMLDQESRENFSSKIKAGKMMEYVVSLPEETVESMAHVLGLDRTGLLRQISQGGLAGNESWERQLQEFGAEDAEPDWELQIPRKEYAKLGQEFQAFEGRDKERGQKMQMPDGEHIKSGREQQTTEGESGESGHKLQPSKAEDTKTDQELQWKACLRQWFEYMEMEDWDEAAKRIQQSGVLVSEHGKTAFGRGQKVEAVEFLNQAEWDEILPVVNLVYQDQRLTHLAKGWLPEKEVFIQDWEEGDREGTKAKDKSSEIEQKRHVLLTWQALLETARENSPWNWTKVQYVKRLKQVPVPELEAILLPVAEKLYSHKVTGKRLLCHPTDRRHGRNRKGEYLKILRVWLNW